MASSAAQIKKNIETLGFKYSDLKILLLMQAHFDHTGALADIKAHNGDKANTDSGQFATYT